MSLLVTGGTGFLGSHLIRFLVEVKGEDVVVFDRFPNRERVADMLDRFTLVEGDVLEAQDVLAVMARHAVDRVIHLAGVPGAAHPDRALQYTRTQCVGTASVFEAARLHGVTRLVNASSVAVFGHDPIAGARPATEDDATRPDDLYGACKLYSEQLADFYNRNHEIEILSLRVSPTLGLGRLNRASLRAGLTTERRNYMAAPEIVVRGETVTTPPEDQVADFLYAVDTAQAFWLAATAPRPEHSVFNLRGEQRTIGDYVHLLRQLMPEAEVEISPGPARLVQLMDNSRLVDELGFQPTYSLEQGLAEYVQQVRTLLEEDFADA